MGLTITAVSGNPTVSSNPTDAANAKVGVGTTHEADVAALRRLWTGTSAAVAGTAVPIAGIWRARIKAAGILGLGTAIATWLFLLLALFEALFLLTIAAIHTMAAVLAVSTSTVAGTSPLAFANGADGAPLALARRNNWRKWRSRRWERRRVGVVTFARRVVITFAFAFAPALTFAFTLTLTLAVASKFEDVVAVTAAALILALTLTVALAAALTLAVVVLFLFLFPFGIRGGEGVGVEGVELPTVDDVGMELDGVVGGHILMVMIILNGICGPRST